LPKCIAVGSRHPILAARLEGFLGQRGEEKGHVDKLLLYLPGCRGQDVDGDLYIRQSKFGKAVSNHNPKYVLAGQPAAGGKREEQE